LSQKNFMLARIIWYPKHKKKVFVNMLFIQYVIDVFDCNSLSYVLCYHVCTYKTIIPTGRFYMYDDDDVYLE
jgi:hypothetical protein